MADILTPDIQIPDSESRTPDDLPGRAPAAAEDTSTSESEESHTEDSHEEVDSEEESATSDEQNEDEHAGDESTDAPPKKKGVQKRIDELTRQRYEAEIKERKAQDEAKYWREQAEAKRQQEQAQTISDKEPRFEDFNSYDDYVKALAKYTVAQEREVEKQQEFTRKHQESHQKIQENFNAQAAAAKKKYEDFDEVAFGNHVAYNQMTGQLVGSSEVGAELAYYLGKNPDLAAKLTTLSPIDAAKEIGRLEAKLKETPKPKPKTITAAPPPVKTVGGNERVKKDPSKMSMTDYIAWRKSSNKSRR